MSSETRLFPSLRVFFAQSSLDSTLLFWSKVDSKADLSFLLSFSLQLMTERRASYTPFPVPFIVATSPLNGGGDRHPKWITSKIQGPAPTNSCSQLISQSFYEPQDYSIDYLGVCSCLIELLNTFTGYA